jgi:hypothetical protein
MKDLYTFDASKELARATYEEVKAAYCRIFDRIGVPYSVVCRRPPPQVKWSANIDITRHKQTRAILVVLLPMNFTMSPQVSDRLATVALATR